MGVAVHGAGDVATQHVKAYLNNQNTKVVAVSSRREESARNLALKYGLKDAKIYTDYSKLLEDNEVDIISICTPQQLHAKEVIEAAGAKKHMLIEKPVALTVEELHETSVAVERSGVRTVVGFVLRWNPVINSLKDSLSKGLLGNIFYVEADYQSYAWEPVPERWDWVRRKETGVSASLVAGVHAIDMIRWLADPRKEGTARIQEVVSYSGGYRKGKLLPPFNLVDSSTETVVPPLEYDGLEVMMMKLDNGAIAKASTNFDALMPYEFDWAVFGDKGTCKNNRLWSTKFAGQREWLALAGDMPNSSSVSAHNFQGEINHLVECIMKEKDSHANLQNAVNTHEAAIAAQISQERGGAPVKLPLA